MLCNLLKTSVHRTRQANLRLDMAPLASLNGWAPCVDMTIWGTLGDFAWGYN